LVEVMRPDAPRPGVLRILRILMEVRNSFGVSFDEDVSFIGSVSSVPVGRKKWAEVGDVDIAITGKSVARGFWTVMKDLLERSIKPVWDVCEVPSDVIELWKPCNSRKEHPLSLTLHCSTNAGTFQDHKQYNLDIKVDSTIIREIPYSSSWMYGNDRQIGCNDAGSSELRARFLTSDMVLQRPADVRFGDVSPSITKLL
jgi:hypothetical protein